MGAGCDEVSRSYLEFFLKKFTAEVEPNDKVVLNNCKVDDNPSLTNASKICWQKILCEDITNIEEFSRHFGAVDLRIPDKERTLTEA
ncbi:hypothetical protein MTR67_000849 [Solanum verrucosum]|uniref:Uncharacterized protein n=1 Tax=Solanum verrucosum TaxID=315347 RepID=A0AAF0T7C0_SOLVR|nr:hypothetical protein MTR67_000849 [Solanum verrucosum]